MVSVLTLNIQRSFFLFLPDDSGSPIFILSSLSVGLVENMFGLRVGTGAGTVEIRKQIKRHHLHMRTNKRDCLSNHSVFLLISSEGKQDLKY